MKNSNRNILLGAGIVGVIGIAIFLSSKSAIASTSSTNVIGDIADTNDLWPIVNKYSQAYGVPQALIYAIMQQESRAQYSDGSYYDNGFFDTHATLMRNPTEIKAGGSQGLMQVLLTTAQMLGYTGTAQGLYDPDTGIKYGVLYIKWIHDNKGIDYSDVGDIAAEYNSNKLYTDAASSTEGTYVPHVMSYYAYYVNELAMDYGVSSPSAQALPSLSVAANIGNTLLNWL